MRIAGGVEAIITQVTVPKQNSNVDHISVDIFTAAGVKIGATLSSTVGNPSISVPNIQLQAGAELKVTLGTSDGEPATGVTLSVAACYTISPTAPPTTPAPTPAPTAPPTPYVCPLAGGMLFSLLFTFTGDD